MLALGAVAFHSDGRELSSFYRKFHPLPGAEPNEETLKWWATQPEAFEEVQKHRHEPQWVMITFGEWCDDQQEPYDGKLVSVAWPAAFDFAFVNYYCHRFLGSNPLGYDCLDIRSYAIGLEDQSTYHGMSEEEIRNLVTIDTSGIRPHFAVDDARSQGRLFMALRNLAVNE